MTYWRAGCIEIVHVRFGGGRLEKGCAQQYLAGRLPYWLRSNDWGRHVAFLRNRVLLGGKLDGASFRRSPWRRRRVPDLLTTKPTQEALNLLDRLVDEHAGSVEQKQVRRPCSANAVLSLGSRASESNANDRERAQGSACALDELSYAAAMSSAYRSAHGPCLTIWFAYFVYVEGVVEEPYPEVLCKEYKIQAALLREIFGNPFHPLPPISFPASVRGVAGSVYQSQDAGEYPILAEARRIQAAWNSTSIFPGSTP